MSEEQLFDKNFGLVIKESKRFAFSFKSLKNNNIDIEDIQQIGAVGLLKALRTYNSETGFTFGTYATKCIRNEIMTELISNMRQKNYNEEIKVVSFNFVISSDDDTSSIEDYIGADDFEFDNVENKQMFNQILDIARDILKEEEFNPWYMYINGYATTDLSKLFDVKRTTLVMRLKSYRKRIVAELERRSGISVDDILA